ncbi:TfoX/Sxy family protein [Marivita lacus]|nr:TfoX/Sxy family protein [Marivita lacus]
MTRKMFGGLGIYSEGSTFAVIGPHEALLIKSRGQLS